MLPAPPGRRKIVLATSIAETSLTIEGVRIVIDSGLARVPRYEPDIGVTRLETKRESRPSRPAAWARRTHRAWNLLPPLGGRRQWRARALCQTGNPLRRSFRLPARSAPGASAIQPNSPFSTRRRRRHWPKRAPSDGDRRARRRRAHHRRGQGDRAAAAAAAPGAHDPVAPRGKAMPISPARRDHADRTWPRRRWRRSWRAARPLCAQRSRRDARRATRGPSPRRAPAPSAELAGAP